MRNKAIFFIIPIIVLIAIGAAGAGWYTVTNKSESDDDIAAHNLSDVATIPDTESAAGADAPADVVVSPSVSEGPNANDIHVTVEGNDPKEPRSIGSHDAPVTLIEFSSLTCPHCADAHAHILPRLIKDYVETGKLRIIFSDFPLNQQALDASKVSRCVANDQYFNFLTLLFSSIEQWAYSNNHPGALLADAVLAGLPEDKARACLEDKSVEESLLQKSQEAMQKYQVNATPTFIFNDGAKMIAGVKPYSEYQAIIDELSAKK